MLLKCSLHLLCYRLPFLHKIGIRKGQTCLFLLLNQMLYFHHYGIKENKATQKFSHKAYLKNVKDANMYTRQLLNKLGSEKISFVVVLVVAVVVSLPSVAYLCSCGLIYVISHFNWKPEAFNDPRRNDSWRTCNAFLWAGRCHPNIVEAGPCP